MGLMGKIYELLQHLKVFCNIHWSSILENTGVRRVNARLFSVLYILAACLHGRISEGGSWLVHARITAALVYCVLCHHDVRELVYHDVSSLHGLSPAFTTERSAVRKLTQCGNCLQRSERSKLRPGWLSFLHHQEIIIMCGVCCRQGIMVRLNPSRVHL